MLRAGRSIEKLLAMVLLVSSYGTKRRRVEPFPELVELVRRIAQTMIVCHIVEEFLRIERSTEQECQIAIGRADNVGNLVDRFPSIKSVLVRQTVLGALCEGYAPFEGFSNAGEESWINDRRSLRAHGHRRVHITGCAMPR